MEHKDKIMDLNLWDGDWIFLNDLINTENEIIIMFNYAGDKLIGYKYL